MKNSDTEGLVDLFILTGYDQARIVGDSNRYITRQPKKMKQHQIGFSVRQHLMH